MKLLRLSITTLFFLYTLAGWAQQTEKSSIIEEIDGVTYYVHLVEPGESLDGLSELYGISKSLILEANPSLKETMALRPNEILLIPQREEKNRPIFARQKQDSLHYHKTDSLSQLTKGRFNTKESAQTEGVATIHTVKPKETLYGISRAYGVTIDELKNLNPGLTSSLRVGQNIRIPKKPSQQPQNVVKNFKGYNFSYYTVKPKETIYGIRKNFNIPEDLFYEMNPDLLTEALKAGQKIRIPHQTTLSEKPEPSLRQQARFADTVNTLRYYKVRFLEKAEGIARREQVSLEKIYELNPDVRQNGVSWGDVIKLPRKAKIKKEIISVEAREKPVRDSTIRYFTHVVKKKQTLYSISKLYGVDQADIIALNPGSEFGIKRGSALRIPVGLDKEKEPVVAEEKEITDISEDADTRVCYAKVGFQNRVRVALMLPLYLDELPRDTSLRTSKNVRSYNFIQFYEGAMLALDTLRQQGVEADVYVYDVGKTAVSARKQFDSRLRSMDLIIGPVYHEAFHEVAQFASEHDIPVVNPFSTRQKITDYRTAFKVATPVKRELDAMARYINRHFDGETNIYVVRSNPYRQLENLAYLKHQLEKYRTPTIMPRHIFDVTYSTDSLNPMLDTLNKSERNVVIGLSEQDIFTINFIRHLNEMRDSIQGVTLFGLSEWKKMDLGTSYLLNLDVHYFDDEFIDYQKPEVKWFIRKFRNRYFTEPMPSKYAFKGFDITHYFVGALARYGKDYRHCIPHYHPFYLETRMDFRPTSKGGFENSFTGLIQFHGYRRVMTKTGRD